jgi:hypothetical protein
MGILDKVKKVTQKDTEEFVEESSSPSSAGKQKVEDVLDLLRIPTTFEVPADVFMPEDLKKVDFDTHVPYGYDLGQVMRFVSQSRTSIKYYVDLLRKRNEDVARLATVVDKLQVDANNLRFEAEIANGISVMPTLDDESLEIQLTEVKLNNRRLEDELRALRSQGAGADDSDRQMNESLFNQLSLVKRENENLRDEVLFLKTQLARIEEEQVDENFSLPIEAAPEGNHDNGSAANRVVDQNVVLPSAAEFEDEKSDALPFIETSGDRNIGFDLDNIEDNGYDPFKSNHGE